MNAKQYQYVAVLALEGSFSRAADALNISQPSLSQFVKKIEKEIGLELFDRANGDVRITDAGRVYLEAGRKIVDVEHQMETAFADLAAFKTGSLIVGTTPYRSASMMPEVAASFRRLYPGMQLVVREATTSELTEGLERGEYDLAVTLLPVDGKLFCREKVAQEELLLAVPAGHATIPAVQADGRRYPAIDARALEGESFVMLTQGQFMQRQLDGLLREYGLRVSVAAVVKSLEAQIEMVKAGVGLALTSGGIERFCKDSDVTFYSFADPLPKREVAVVWRKDRKLSRVAEDLKGMIRAVRW